MGSWDSRTAHKVGSFGGTRDILPSGWCASARRVTVRNRLRACLLAVLTVMLVFSWWRHVVEAETMN